MQGRLEDTILFSWKTASSATPVILACLVPEAADNCCSEQNSYTKPFGATSLLARSRMQLVVYADNVEYRCWARHGWGCRHEWNGVTMVGQQKSTSSQVLASNGTYMYVYLEIYIYIYTHINRDKGRREKVTADRLRASVRSSGERVYFCKGKAT